MTPPPDGGTAPAVPRRAVLAALAGAAAGCGGSAHVPGLSSLTARFQAIPSEGRMLAQVPAGERDVAAMAREQDRILRLQRAEAPYGLVHAPEFRAYLDGVLGRLGARAPGPRVPARAAVVTSRDWSANATAPGAIFVPLALVESLQDEDQLAFVLGHELGHVLLRHHDSDWLVKAQKHALALASLGLAAREQLQPRRARRGDDDAEAGVAAAEAVLAVSDKMLAPAWTRQQEHQADLLGVDLMVAAGYNPDAAVEVLEQMTEWTRGAGQEYRQSPRQLARRTARPRGRRRDGVDVEAVWQATLDAVLGAFEGIADLHPEPDKRLEVVQLYLEREYAGTRRPAARVEPWRAARSRPAMREVLRNYARAYEARARLAQRDVAGAERRAIEAASGSTAAHHFPCYTLAEVYQRSGRVTLARQHLVTALDAPEPALEAYLALAALDTRRGWPQDAVTVLEDGRRRFADHPRAWPYLIWLYRRTGRAQEAQALQLRCQVEFPDFTTLCDGSRQA